MYYVIRINKLLSICEIVDKSENRKKCDILLDKYNLLEDNSAYRITAEYLNSWGKLQKYLQER